MKKLKLLVIPVLCTFMFSSCSAFLNTMETKAVDDVFEEETEEVTDQNTTPDPETPATPDPETTGSLAERRISELAEAVKALAEEVKKLKEERVTASAEKLNISAELINPFIDSISATGSKYDLLQKEEKKVGYDLLSR